MNNILSVLSMLLEDGRRVGRDRPDAMHDPVAARPEGRGSVLRLRRVRAASGAAEAIDARAHLIVLLGGDAGCGAGR